MFGDDAAGITPEEEHELTNLDVEALVKEVEQLDLENEAMEQKLESGDVAAADADIEIEFHPEEPEEEEATHEVAASEEPASAEEASQLEEPQEVESPVAEEVVTGAVAEESVFVESHAEAAELTAAAAEAFTPPATAPVAADATEETLDVFEDEESVVEAREEEEGEWGWEDGQEEIAYADHPSTGSSSSNRLLMVAIIVLAMTAALGISAYVAVDRRNNQQERIAAQGLSDTAMALLYAKLTHDVPPSGRWISPEFLEENLEEVLSSRYRAQSPIDSHGNIVDSSYNLRVAAAPDQSRLLVVAVPYSGVIQWLVPKNALFVDTLTMTAYATFATEALDQALVAVANQEKGEEVSLTPLLQVSEKLPLESLNIDNPQDGFAPPQDLAARRPGAEERIYNAPRYYKFSRPLIAGAAKLAADNPAQRDIQRLHDLVALYAQFDDMVIWSSWGQEDAIDALYSLNDHVADHSLLLGHLTFTGNGGFIASSELLPKDPSTLAAQQEAQRAVAARQSARSAHSLSHRHHRASGEIVSDGPLLAQLQALAEERERALQSAADDLVTLVRQQAKEAVADFQRRYVKLTKTFDEAEQAQSDKIRATLAHLYDAWTAEHGIASGATFAAYVSAAKLDRYLPSEVVGGYDTANGSAAPSVDTMMMLAAVQESQNLSDLDDTVAKAAAATDHDQFSDPSECNSYQNKLRSTALRKVTDFLLSPRSAQSPETFRAHNRVLLTRVLNNAGVSEQEEADFYLREFDFLMDKFRHQASQHDLTESESTHNLRYQITGKVTPASDEEAHKKQEDDEETRQVGMQLQAIPLDRVAATGDTDETRNYGRLGQQILARESLQRASVERDENLAQAISLLMQATDENRAYWRDVLEARRLMTETSKEAIVTSLHSPLGFADDVQPYFQKIHSSFLQYVSELHNIAAAPTPQQYQRRYKQVSRSQHETLNDIIKDGEQMQREAAKLSQSFSKYVARLESYLKDYETAKRQGFFVTNSHYHNRGLTMLKRKVRSAREMKTRLEGITTQIGTAGDTYDTLARMELEKLDSKAPITAKDPTKVEKRAAHASYPNLTSEDWLNKATQLLDWNISPIP